MVIITTATGALVQSPGTGGLGNKRTKGDHPNYRIVEIGQNTKKNPGDLKRFVVTQTSVESHQLTPAGKKNSQMSRITIIMISGKRTPLNIAQSGGAVEYTDCTSAEG